MRPLAVLLVAGCTKVELDPPPGIVPGPPEVGAAEATLDLPIGTPLGGYSARALVGISRPDRRASAYDYAFVPSAGVHTRPGLKVIWITNGDQDFVLTQTDVIYSYDGLVTRLTAELESRTGRDLDGRVAHATNHSHNSYGPFSDQVHFYLGGDRFNREIFDRFVEQLVDVAMAAFESRVPAAIGTGWKQDWDPDDRVYRDRRGDNNELVMFADLPPGGYGKEPFLNVMRFDTTDGTPIAMTYAIPIHGTMVGENSPMISSDAGGGVTHGLEEAFDRPVVVMQLQTGGGDASPAGQDDGFARVESLGELARAPIMELYDRIATSDAPIAMETVSRHIWQHKDMIHVRRGGTQDWSYVPWEGGPTSETPAYVPDEVVYDESGAIISPLDEFDTPFGAAFCGSDSPLIPGGGVYSDTYPYSSCVQIDRIMPVIDAYFDLEDPEGALPLMESMKAGTLATRIGPIPTVYPDGSSHDDPLYAAFFPAEPTSMFVEQARRRVRTELGFEWPLIVGYAQDHEGYFLPPEDWLMGGYEPNINLWGPLQAEHVMEGVLAYSAEILSTTDVAEEEDPDGYYAPTEYPDRALPTEYLPDLTDEAGTPVTEIAEEFWLPDGYTLDLDVPAEVPRVQGIVQMAWHGGDVMVDLPRVVLERQEGAAWVPVRTGSGRVVDDRYGDMVMAYTPVPLYPITEDQRHEYWVAWQAVPHGGDRLALPLGRYRLAVAGQKWAGGDAQWPWTTEPYAIASAEFEVVPAEVTVEVDGEGLWASVRGPADGWRLLDLEGHSQGANPVRGTVHVAVTRIGVEELDVAPDRVVGGRAHLPVDTTDAVSVTVTDAHGNTGTWAP